MNDSAKRHSEPQSWPPPPLHLQVSNPSRENDCVFSKPNKSWLSVHRYFVCRQERGKVLLTNHHRPLTVACIQVQRW